MQRFWLFVIWLFVCIGRHLATKLKIELLTYPIEFTKDVELVCKFLEGGKPESMNWYRLSDKKFIAINNVSVNQDKYQVHLGKTGHEWKYKLTIHDFDRLDVNKRYRCDIDFHSTIKNISLNENDFIALPEKEAINTSIEIKKNVLHVDIGISNVYPVPSCRIMFDRLDLTNELLLETTNNSIFYNTRATLQHETKTCKGNVKLVCTVGIKKFELSKTIDNCEAKQITAKTATIEVYIVGCFIVLTVLIELLTHISYQRFKTSHRNEPDCYCDTFLKIYFSCIIPGLFYIFWRFKMPKNPSVLHCCTDILFCFVNNLYILHILFALFAFFATIMKILCNVTTAYHYLENNDDIIVTWIVIVCTVIWINCFWNFITFRLNGSNASDRGLIEWQFTKNKTLEEKREDDIEMEIMRNSKTAENTDLKEMHCTKFEKIEEKKYGNVTLEKEGLLLMRFKESGKMEEKMGEGIKMELNLNVSVSVMENEVITEIPFTELQKLDEKKEDEMNRDPQYMYRFRNMRI